MRVPIGASFAGSRVSIGASQVGETITLTIIIDGNGDVDLDPPGGNYESPVTVTLTAEADPGWAFDHWEDDLTGSDNPDDLYMDADKTVTCVFVETGNPSQDGMSMMLGCHF